MVGSVRGERGGRTGRDRRRGRIFAGDCRYEWHLRLQSKALRGYDLPGGNGTEECLYLASWDCRMVLAGTNEQVEQGGTRL